MKRFNFKLRKRCSIFQEISLDIEGADYKTASQKAVEAVKQNSYQDYVADIKVLEDSLEDYSNHNQCNVELVDNGDYVLYSDEDELPYQPKLIDSKNWICIDEERLLLCRINKDGTYTFAIYIFADICDRDVPYEVEDLTAEHLLSKDFTVMTISLDDYEVEDLVRIGWKLLPDYSYAFNQIEKARCIFEANL